MATIPSFDETHLEQICGVLGATDSGLTGSEIGSLLAQAGIKNDFPTATKRRRLFVALCNRQRSDGCANHIVAFIQKVMDPVRYTADRDRYDRRRNALNQVLAFSGYAVGEDGKLRQQQAALS